MYLVCDMYGKLVEWKQDSHSILELEGVGQYGKACVVYKFVEQNFSRIVSMNLLEISGRQFLECYKGAAGMGYSSGFPKSENPLYDALRMFHPYFEDTEDTVVIVDEIQEFPEIYEQICIFSKRSRCRFIVTGSCRGRDWKTVTHTDLA